MRLGVQADIGRPNRLCAWNGKNPVPRQMSHHRSPRQQSPAQIRGRRLPSARNKIGKLSCYSCRRQRSAGAKRPALPQARTFPWRSRRAKWIDIFGCRIDDRLTGGDQDQSIDRGRFARTAFVISGLGLGTAPGGLPALKKAQIRIGAP
jgi:hypothetical protein